MLFSQKHYVKPMDHVFQTDAYFASVPKKNSASLFVLRETIFDVFPNVYETLIDGIPTYLLHGKVLCALANHSNSMALYIKPHDLLLEFEEELEQYNWHRSSIRFNKIENEDILFFERMLHFVGTNYHKSGYYQKILTETAL